MRMGHMLGCSAKHYRSFPTSAATFYRDTMLRLTYITVSQFGYESFGSRSARFLSKYIILLAIVFMIVSFCAWGMREDLYLKA